MALNPFESCRCVFSPEVMVLVGKLPTKCPFFEITIWGVDFCLLILLTYLFHIKV